MFNGEVIISPGPKCDLCGFDNIFKEEHEYKWWQHHGVGNCIINLAYWCKKLEEKLEEKK